MDFMAAVGRMHLGADVAGVVAGKRTEASDEALVSAARNGDRSAFGTLYERYSRMVHGILLARVPPQVAEDLLQDVFLQALPRLGSLRDASRFGGWLAAIARNRAHDHHRRSRPMQEWSEASAAGNVGETPGEMVSDGLLLLEAVRSLPEAYRETLILRFVEGMTGPEIAEKTGLKHGSVRVNLCRGIEMLREKLAK
jgi:RNA polymerase sigma-70 factor (ECF subfamily)